MTWHCNGVAVQRPKAQLAKAAAQLGAALDIAGDGDGAAGAGAGGTGAAGGAGKGGAGGAGAGGKAGGGAGEVQVTTVADDGVEDQDALREQVVRQIGEAKLAELVSVVKATSGADARAGVAKVRGVSLWVGL